MGTPGTVADLIRARIVELLGPDPEPDDFELVRHVLRNVSTRTPTTFAALEAAVSRGDVRSAAELAHSMKGSLGNVGGEACAVILERLECHLRHGDSDQLTDLPLLANEVGALIAAIHDVLTADLL